VKVAIDIRRMTEFGVARTSETWFAPSPASTAKTSTSSSDRWTKSWNAGRCPQLSRLSLDGGDNTLSGNLAFRSIVRRLQCDLVHIPHLFWIPRGLGCPYVLTVHDLLEHMYGSRDASSVRRSLHFYLTRRVLRRAARVIAVSQFTRNEIEKLLAIPDARIEVVYNAIDERFLHGHASDADRELIAQRYLVNYPFILYAGAIRPTKM